MVVLAVAVIVLANRSGGSGAPSQPGPFSLPGPAETFTAFDVRQADGSALTVAPAGGGSTQAVTLADGTVVEALRPAAAGAIEVGDWVVVIGIPNEVRNFAITRLAVITEPGDVGADGLARSPGGFVGVEGSRNGEERAITGGSVQSASSDGIVLDGPSGDITIAFEGAPPVFLLASIEAAEVRPGDRLVIAGDGALDAAEAVLVVPEGLGE